MKKQHSYYVYITTNPKKSVLYVGMTNNLARRLVEHYANRGKDTTFAGRYYAYNLIYCEYFQYVNQAIAREKELKGWIRLRKEELIATKNPTWKFFNDKFCGEWPPRKVWGSYLAQFKDRKKLKDKPLNEEPSICIYKEDSESIKVVNNVQNSQEKPTNTNHLISKPERIKQQMLDTNKLSKRERYLLKIALLTALGNQEQLATTIKQIPKEIVTKKDIEAVLLQTGFYTGLSTVKPMLMKIDLFFEETP